MIGELPTKLNNWAIRSDYRIALTIFQALNDAELTDEDKALIILKLLYVDFDDMQSSEYEEALKQASWYLDGGREYKVKSKKKIIDWEQDEQMIFSAVNKVANKETRECKYIHWWTFLGYMSEIGEGLFSTVLNIRSKKNEGKKLEKYEEEYYKKNKDIVDIKSKYSTEEQEEIDRLKEIFS